MKFYLPDFGETVEDSRDCENNPHDLASAAERAAEFCHAKRNGWEWSWPVNMVILDEENHPHTFSVEREMYPFFRATKKK